MTGLGGNCRSSSVERAEAGTFIHDFEYTGYSSPSRVIWWSLVASQGYGVKAREEFESTLTKDVPVDYFKEMSRAMPLEEGG